MNRQRLTMGLFAALLVGCAASAMRFGAPDSASASIQNQSHVKPDTTTVVCYKPGGGDCVSSYHEVHGLASVELYGPCYNGQGCILHPDIALTSPATFANKNYDCTANQSGEYSITYGVIFDFDPISTSSFEVVFRNETGATLPIYTTFHIAYTCFGPT